MPRWHCRELWPVKLKFIHTNDIRKENDVCARLPGYEQGRGPRARYILYPSWALNQVLFRQVTVPHYPALQPKPTERTILSLKIFTLCCLRCNFALHPPGGYGHHFLILSFHLTLPLFPLYLPIAPLSSEYVQDLGYVHATLSRQECECQMN